MHSSWPTESSSNFVDPQVLGDIITITIDVYLLRVQSVALVESDQQVL